MKKSKQDATPPPQTDDSNENADIPSIDSNNKSAASSSTSIVSSLIYLEDIHIFALANLLSRTIIVLSLEVYRNVQPIHLRGIYLPLLIDASECIKDPIVIAFHNFHFMPLIFGIDDTIDDFKEDKNASIKATEKYFHFENIDNLIYENLTDGSYQQIYKYDESFKLSKANIKRKENTFHNILPLIYYNTLEEMKVHFLNEKEEKNSLKYIKSYLNTCSVNINIEELGLTFSDTKDQTTDILCCFLSKTSEKLKKNGLSIYLEFINQSIKSQKESSYSRNYSYEPTSYSPVSNTTMAPYSRTTFEANNKTILCVSTRCHKEALSDKEKYSGFCVDCFNERNYSNVNDLPLSRNDTKTKEAYEDAPIRRNVQVINEKSAREELRDIENQLNPTQQRVSSARQREEINTPMTRKIYDSSDNKSYAGTSDFIQPNRKQVI
jgi:hypothetical protein